jgi:hypothetical protein
LLLRKGDRESASTLTLLSDRSMRSMKKQSAKKTRLVFQFIVDGIQKNGNGAEVTLSQTSQSPCPAHQ